MHSIACEIYVNTAIRLGVGRHSLSLSSSFSPSPTVRHAPPVLEILTYTHQDKLLYDFLILILASPYPHDALAPSAADREMIVSAFFHRYRRRVARRYDWTLRDHDEMRHVESRAAFRFRETIPKSTKEQMTIFVTWYIILCREYQ